MNAVRTLVAGWWMLLCLGGCTTVHSRADVRDTAPAASEDGIVLLSNLANDQDFDDDDVDTCLHPVMRKLRPEFRFVPAQQFREQLYPYFSPSTTPHAPEGYRRLLDEPEIRQRIAALAVRYLVILTQHGTAMAWHGGILCGASAGGGGCLGLSWWQRSSELGLAVWDLRSKTNIGAMQARSTGTGFMPAFLLPIPLYTPATEAAVCDELGRRLARLLGGE